jgi:sugar-specific transcriptional regulator TrmB
LSEYAVKQVLKDLNITETEAEIYLSLSKYPVSKGTEIARIAKKDKAQVYHILKSLQAKGLVETTLEAPVRYTPVPFEKVIDSLINSKREEAQRIEKTKEGLLTYWQTLNRTKLVNQIEKFLVVEGRKKVNNKIAEMIAETKRQFCIVATVPDLLKAEQDGLVDVASRHPFKSKIDFRFLVNASEGTSGLNLIFDSLSNSGFNFRCRNPSLPMHLSPEMIIRDDQEALFFIQPNNNDALLDEYVCLWTNCKSLVHTFLDLFDDHWINSIDVISKENQATVSQKATKNLVLVNSKGARKKYFEVLQSAKKEVLIVTSPIGLVELDTAPDQIWLSEGVHRKVMAPITRGNLNAARHLSNHAEVRHVSNGYLGSTVIDGKHLFQFRIDKDEDCTSSFENVFYSDEQSIVEKTLFLLKAIWDKSQPPSSLTLESIANATISSGADHVVYEATKKMLNHKVTPNFDVSKKISEKSVIEKIIKAQKSSPQNHRNDIVTYYTVNGQAIINPPKNLNLPITLFHTYHIEKHSTFGAQDAVMVHLWQKTPQGEFFVPSALVTDNVSSVDFWKKALGATPAESNIILVDKDKLEACIHGNTLFVGWTSSIPLPNAKSSIPPSFLQIEGYGKVITDAYQASVPSGYTLKTEGNIMEAFVTYMHTSSKYSGPGTEGAFGRDVIIEVYPP